MSYDQAGPGGAGQDGDAGGAAEFVERVDQRRSQAALGRAGVGERGGEGGDERRPDPERRDAQPARVIRRAPSRSAIRPPSSISPPKNTV